MTAIYVPFVYFILSETRAPVILRRKAKKLRKTRGMTDGGRYTARSEIGKPKLLAMMKTSCVRPLRELVYAKLRLKCSLHGSGTDCYVLLAVDFDRGEQRRLSQTEPQWAVLYIQIAGANYIFTNIYGFSVTGESIAVLLGGC